MFLIIKKRVLLPKNGKTAKMVYFCLGKAAGGGMDSSIIVWAMSVVNSLCQRQIVDKAFDKSIDNFGLVSV